MSPASEPDPAPDCTVASHRPPVRAHVNYRRLPLLAVSILALLAASWAGLLRLGWSLPVIQPGLYVAHGPLMVCGFLGTLISLERAVALGESWSYAAPILSAAGALALMFGVPDPVGALLITAGSLGLIANFIAIIRRQAAMFTVTMGLGALAWFVGNCLWLAQIPIVEMFFWWIGFLVLTIVGERLELSRLTGLGDRNRKSFILGVNIFLAGLGVASVRADMGLRIAGLGMSAMALWLWRYDLARRTVRQQGLTRFIAVNLLAGYFWLGIAAAAWLWFGDDLTTFHYDVMLHAVFLGFVFSMIFAHAPVIFPAVLQRPLPYRRSFYIHSALLHLSLLLRIGGDFAASYPAYRWGGLLNVVALLVFVGNTARSVASGILAGRKGGRRAATPCDVGG
ncbi:MAG TPA: hypothetical protein VNF49_13320 [Candidatus Binataceae bacterium]|nr:hypothetical protein [Candidatus Binataceae bacterium]